jgi:hypothetical protein
VTKCQVYLQQIKKIKKKAKAECKTCHAETMFLEAFFFFGKIEIVEENETKWKSMKDCYQVEWTVEKV